MHPLAGTKRGAFPVHQDEETQNVSDGSLRFHAKMSKAEDILRAHFIAKDYLDELPTEEAWRNLPEVPNSEEINGSDTPIYNSEPEKWNEYQNDPVYNPKIPQNIVDGPWPSSKAYISAHYRILREDTVASLREAVQKYKRSPDMMEDDLMYIYTEVTITGWQLTKKGPACRVEFSTDRSGVRIRWEQSKRLMQGTMVALSNSLDLFKSDCRMAIVAGRSIEGGLDQSPQTIDLFLGDHDKVWLDPHEKYVMIEAREGYFEASRYMLKAMQKLMFESFTLQKYLVFLDKKEESPQYLIDQPLLNFTSLQKPGAEDPLEHKDTKKAGDELMSIDVIRAFPNNFDFGMDDSQMRALRAILTNRISIVQGPPGTGKTFVSVSSLKVMIDNLGPNDPPIIVAAQTNHALDQLLNHIIKFEPKILRLGGQSARTNTQIRESTLYELHQANHIKGSIMGGRMGRCTREFKNLEAKLGNILAPLLTDKLLTSDQLVEYKIITEEQRKSFSAPDWADNDAAEGELASWLGKDQIMAIARASPINDALPLEEDFSENDQRKMGDLDEDIIDLNGSNSGTLKGPWIPFKRKYTGNHMGVVDTRKWRKRLSKLKDIYEIRENERGTAYRYFEMRVNHHILKSFKHALKEYENSVYEYQITSALRDIELIDHLGIKIIGCTTSGLAKYRGLLSALQPRTLLIEEAAETLEGKVLAGIPESIQQMVMVGDHQQLQASCTVRPLQEAPYHMRISMFERLINNNLSYVMLNRQRRMIPEIRELLCIKPKPFYKKLYDHEIVLDRVNARAPIPGMGGKDTYFFHHNWPEARNIEGSCYNEDEAEMVVAFYYYLFLNGIETSKITILTFYRGQKNLILRILKNHASLLNIGYFNVHTVDGYQGEENDVILLSLVRSNMPRSIGFLDNKNRLVVALSRARRGLFIFGNSVTLSAGESDGSNAGREPLWLPLLCHMASKSRFDIDKGLPLTCVRHKRTTIVLDAGELTLLSGGCDRPCDRGPLSCNHKCPLKCHVFEHEMVSCCQEPCAKELVCGHVCSRNCGAVCCCDLCGLKDEDPDKVKLLETSLTDERKLLTQSDPLESSVIRGTENYMWSASLSMDKRNVKLETNKVMMNSGQKKWGEWDPQRADQESLDQARQGIHVMTESPVVLDDFHTLIVVEDGLRKTSTPNRTVITDSNSKSISDNEMRNTYSRPVQNNSRDRGNVLIPSGEKNSWGLQTNRSHLPNRTKMPINNHNELISLIDDRVSDSEDISTRYKDKTFKDCFNHLSLSTSTTTGTSKLSAITNEKPDYILNSLI